MNSYIDLGIYLKNVKNFVLKKVLSVGVYKTSRNLVWGSYNSGFQCENINFVFKSLLCSLREEAFENFLHILDF